MKLAQLEILRRAGARNETSLTEGESHTLLAKRSSVTQVEPRGPASPKWARPSFSTSMRDFDEELLPAKTTQCWCCSSTLRDPGASFFSCGACGALNGELASVRSGLAGCVFRRCCRRLARFGCLLRLLVFSLFAAVVVQACGHLLPRVAGDSPLGASAVLHGGVTLLLVAGTGFNMLATVLAGPGYVKEECNPMLSSRAAGLPPSAALTELIHERGSQPMRGWRRCKETGLSMPPRSHYCRTCREVVLRMDSYCYALHTCVGHANYHYYVTRGTERRPRRPRPP